MEEKIKILCIIHNMCKNDANRANFSGKAVKISEKDSFSDESDENKQDDFSSVESDHFLLSCAELLSKFAQAFPRPRTRYLFHFFRNSKVELCLILIENDG